MKQPPVYKSIKVTFETWQALTRISAATGETRTDIMGRLARAEEQVVKGSQQASEGLGDKGATEEK